MATKRRKKASGVWTAIYVVILILWILFLSACGLYVLNEVWNYARTISTASRPICGATEWTRWSGPCRIRPRRTRK